MSDRNEDKIRQDFNSAMQTLENAFYKAIFAAFNWGESIGQMLGSIKKHKEELQTEVQTTLTTGQPPQNPALASTALDQRLNTLAQQNQAPTAEQKNQLEKANVTSALLGHPLTESSRDKALAVVEQLDHSLGIEAKEVKQLRMPQSQQLPEQPAAQQDQRPQLKR